MRKRITAEMKQELERLKKGGKLKIADVVRAARNKNNPLHAWFDFNSTNALDFYLEEQARQLIGQYYVVYANPETGARIRTRQYVSLSIDRQHGGGFRTIADVLSDSKLKAQLLDDALAVLVSFKQRYQNLKELSEIFQAIGKLQSRRSKVSA